MKQIITLFLLSMTLTSNAQKHEIGIAVLSYDGSNFNYSLSDKATNQTYKANKLQPVLTYNYINAKNTDFYLQAGYFHTKTTDLQNYKGYNLYGKYVDTRITKSTYLKLGIAKRFEFGKLLLITGVNMPFEYNFYDVETSSTNEINSTTNLPSYYMGFYNKQSPIYVTGLNLHLSFYYQLIKNLYLGADLNLGCQTTIYKGNQHYKKEWVYYDAPANNNTNEQVVSLKKFHNSLNFQPTVGIRYCFLKKKNAVVVP
jgi:hypothetical protein